MGLRESGATDILTLFDGTFGAYVHVPFCERICPFCPYNKVVASDARARAYFAALETEIRWYVEAGAGPFTSLYIGGGTPTLYPEALARVIRGLPSTGEVAIEVLPTHGSPERLDALARMGVTAVSIGAQSFHDPVLRRLHRPHDSAAARAAVLAALGRFTTVDVDLIVDVAWEDDEVLAGAFLADLRTCLELGVDQVSTYPLMRFGYTPFGTARADRRREHEVLRAAEEIAADHGYERRSVWTLNRKGSADYTSITRPRFLGLGAGAASYAGRDLLVNHFGLAAYCGAVEQGRVPRARHFRLGAVGGGAYAAFWQAYAGKVGGHRMTPRGRDAYHDLERWVTHAFIEPLWAEMLTEHGGAAGWAAPPHSRASIAWRLARPLVEVKTRRAGLESGPRCAIRDSNPEPAD